MKRNHFLLCLMLLIPSVPSFCLDAGVQVWTGNLGFRTDRASTDASFPGADYLLGYSATMTQPIAESFSFEAGFYLDPILRNISYTLFQYDEKVISIGVGPFFGFFNDLTTILKSGISTSVKLELPGIAFIKFRTDSSIGGELIEVGSYLQEKNDVALGFYVRNAICSLNMVQRKFTQKQPTNTVIDALTEYFFKTEIFRKNVPYRVDLTLGYQTLLKSYVGDAETVNHVLNSVIIGTAVDFAILDFLTFQADLESNVYTFGQGELVGSSSAYLFRVRAGVLLNLDRLLESTGSTGL